MTPQNGRMAQKTSAVILDLGNVVLNWNVNGILASLDFTEDIVGHLRDELFLHQDWIDLDHGLVSETEVTEAICARAPLTRAQIEATLTKARQSMQPIPQSLALMQDLHAAGLPLYCLSNMSRESYAHIREQEFFRLFSGIVISGIERCMKPHADIFHLLLDRFALEPGDALFVDDLLSNVEAAAALGIRGFHFKRSDRCYASLRQMLL